MYTHKTFLNTLFIGFILALSFVFFAHSTSAAAIQAGSQYSQFLDTSHGRINWLPTTNTDPVSVTLSGITGRIWGEDVGWINLAPDNSGVTLTCGGGVATLGGYAWGENTGWINFDTATSGVTINTAGEFDGYAWSQNFGWINFTCPGNNTCVKTDFSCLNPPPYGDDDQGNEPATCELAAIPSVISPGQSATLSWTTNIDSGNLTSGDINHGIGSVSTENGSVVVQPSQTTVYKGDFSGKYVDGTAHCTADITVEGTPPPGSLDESEITIEKPSYFINEGGDFVTITVLRKGDLSEPVSVVISTKEGSATVSDYDNVSQTLTWDAGDDTPKTISIAIVDDTIAETTESFVVTLSNPINAVYGSVRTANISIVDNDVDVGDPGQIRFVQSEYQVTENGKIITVYVARVAGSQGPASVVVTTKSDEAEEGGDFETKTQTLNWLDGKTGSLPFDIVIVDDSIQESLESFVVELSEVTGAVLTTPEMATITVIDNDDPDSFIGCLDPSAENYSSLAITHNQDLCNYGLPGVVYGCTDPSAENYNIQADQDNGSCQYDTKKSNDTSFTSVFKGVNDLGSKIAGFFSGLTSFNINPGSTTIPSGVKDTFNFLAIAGLLAGLPGVVNRLWNILVSFLGFRKKHRPWGTVYNAETKQPLDPAYVTLLNETGKEVASAITDPDGRYGFLVDPGVYTIRAQKTHFIFPSRNLEGKTRDVLYTDLYFGNAIEVTERGQVIKKNIPMDPVGEDWNEQEKQSMGKSIFKFFSRYDKIAVRIINILFVFGFIASAIIVYVSPSIVNILVLAIYIFMALLFLIGLAPKSAGAVTGPNGKPLSFAIVRVFNAHLNKEIAHRVTNEFGQYFILVQKGSYYITIEHKEADGTYTHIHTSEVFKVRQGVINRDFEFE